MQSQIINLYNKKIILNYNLQLVFIEKIQTDIINIYETYTGFYTEMQIIRNIILLIMNIPNYNIDFNIKLIYNIHILQNILSIIINLSSTDYELLY